MILIWFSVKCENALENKEATNSCIYRTLSTFGGPNGLLILFASTNLNMYAKMVACIANPEIHRKNAVEYSDFANYGR